MCAFPLPKAHAATSFRSFLFFLSLFLFVLSGFVLFCCTEGFVSWPAIRDPLPQPPKCWDHRCVLPFPEWGYLSRRLAIVPQSPSKWPPLLLQYRLAMQIRRCFCRRLFKPFIPQIDAWESHHVQADLLLWPQWCPTPGLFLPPWAHMQ